MRELSDSELDTVLAATFDRLLCGSNTAEGPGGRSACGLRLARAFRRAGIDDHEISKFLISLEEESNE